MLFLKIQLFPPPTLSVSARRKKFQSKNRKENPIDMINVLLRRITIEQNLKNNYIFSSPRFLLLYYKYCVLSV